MSFKSATQPLCRYCGKPIAKHTVTVWFDWFGGGHRDERPTSRAEVARLTNQHVASVRWSKGEDYYAKRAGFDFIYQASTWDGESYVDAFFCNGEHARRFAYVFARSGGTTEAYENARKAALKEKDDQTR